MRSNVGMTFLLAGVSALAATACAPSERVQSAAVADLTAAVAEDLPAAPAPGPAEPAPVSALVSFEVFARPALLKMAGHTKIYRPREKLF